LNEKEIKEIIPTNLKDRLKLLNSLRKPGVHFKGTKPFSEEAKLASETVKKSIESFLGA
jgi:hypothetical protein